MPIVALYGYYTGNMTLFYWVGSVVAILDVICLFNGELGCLGTILTLACWSYAYHHTDGLWESIILGSCYAFAALMGLMSLLYIPVVFAAIVGIVIYPFVWLKEKLF